MREWKEGDDSLIMVEGDVVFDKILGGPSQVIVGDHGSLWWTGGTRGVDKGGTLTNLNIIRSLLELIIRNGFTSGEELGPVVNWNLNLGLQGLVDWVLTPVEDSLKVWKVVGKLSILGELLVVLKGNDLSLGVLSDVLTGIWSVSGVNTSTDAASIDSTDKGKDPLRLKRRDVREEARRDGK